MHKIKAKILIVTLLFLMGLAPPTCVLADNHGTNHPDESSLLNEKTIIIKKTYTHDSREQSREDFEVDLCLGSFTELAGPENMVSYMWSTGEPFRFITVNPTVTTNYWVDYETPGGDTFRDNFTVYVHPLPVFEHSEDTVVSFPGMQVTLWISGGYSWDWSNGDSDSLIHVFPETTTSYSCVVSTPEGCSLTQDFHVVVRNINIPVETVCDGDPLTLTGPEGMNWYLWNTNETTQSITFYPDNPSVYWVEYETPGLDVLRDSTFVNISYPPEYTHSPSEVIIGLGQNTTLWVSGGESYLWSDNSTDSSLVVTATSSSQIFWVEIRNADGCVATHEFTVNSKFFVLDDETICEGDSVTLTAPADMQSYEWSTGSIEQSITVKPTSTTLYWCEIVTPNLLFERDSALITVLPKPEIIDSSPANVSITPGEEVSLWIHANPGNNYLWNTGSTDTLITVAPTISTAYWVDFSSDGSCERRQEYFVSVTYPSEAMFSYDSVCAGAITTLINRSETMDTIVNVSWDLNSDGNFDDAEGDTVTYVFPGADLYLVGMRLTLKSGNLDLAFNSVPVGDTPNMEFVFQDNCFGATTSFLDKSTVFVGNLEYRIWNYGDGSIDTTHFAGSSTHYYSTGGDFSTQLTTITDLGCRDSITNTVSIVNPPWFMMLDENGNEVANGDTTALADGDTLVLTVDNVASYDSIVWNGNTTADIFYVTEIGSYSAEAFRSGCFTTQDFYVVSGTGPPNPGIDGIMSLFTPNGDGVNDYWTVNDDDIVFPIKVNIYNRYGNLVYSDNSYSNDWDGQFKGNPLPQSTYYYVIEDQAGNIVKGPITIIR